MAKVLLEPDFSALFLRYIVTVGTRTFQTYELTAWPCDLQTSCQANDHHIPFGHQCLDTFLILQMCGTGPHSPPQPLSNALSSLGPFRGISF